MKNDEQNQMTILVVDDTESNIDMLLAILKEHDVIPATSGEDALSLLEEEAVDLILLDIIMPEMDGFEVCETLKSNPDTKDIPVIFITAKDDEDSIEKAYSIGGVDYITKPFRPRELIARVRTHLKLQQTQLLLKKQNETQRELLHVLCHDLTNPIGAIESYVEYIQEFPHETDIIQQVQVAARDGMKIIDLTRNLMAADEKSMTLYPVNIIESLFQSMAILKVKLDSKKIRVDIDIPEDLIVMAEDVSLSNTVFNNLMTNAIKFSEPGDVIKIYLEKEDRTTVNMVIQDAGIGIPDDLLESLFDISKSTNRPGTNGEEGTGFGMPLVKKFMEKYGGDIIITSRSNVDFPADHGTRVHLQFNKYLGGHEK